MWVRRAIQVALEEGDAVLRDVHVVPGVDIAPEILLVIAGAAVAVSCGLAGWMWFAHAVSKSERSPIRSPPPELIVPHTNEIRTEYSFLQLAILTSPTLAYSCTATNLAFLLLPDEARTFQYEASWTLGLLYAVGALAELPGPLLGHASDCLRTPFGRRRPFVLFAATCIIAATCVQWLGAMHGNLPIFAMALLVHMLGWALLYTAQQGLVLDVLNDQQLSIASSCQALFVAIGACGAFIIAAALPAALHYHYLYAVTSLLTLVTSIGTVLISQEQAVLPDVYEERVTSYYGLLQRYYWLDFRKQYDFSLVMVCKALMYGGGVAKGYLVYFLRDTWNVVDTRKLHLKVASIAICAECCAAATAGLLLMSSGQIGPNRAAVAGASIIACSWCVMIPLGFWDEGYALTELFALVYGVGHGLVLVGDQALTYQLIPTKAHGSRSFGLQSVAAFVGMSTFAFLCSLVLDLFGRVSEHRMPGPRAGPIPADGYRLEGYVALFLFVTAANLVWAYLFSKIRIVSTDRGLSQSSPG